jgi:hypothetical protein
MSCSSCRAKTNRLLIMTFTGCLSLRPIPRRPHPCIMSLPLTLMPGFQQCCKQIRNPPYQSYLNPFLINRSGGGRYICTGFASWFVIIIIIYFWFLTTSFGFSMSSLNEFIRTIWID